MDIDASSHIWNTLQPTAYPKRASTDQIMPNPEPITPKDAQTILAPISDKEWSSSQSDKRTAIGVANDVLEARLDKLKNSEHTID